MEFMRTIMERGGKFAEEINCRITAAQKLFHAISNGFLNDNHKNTIKKQLCMRGYMRRVKLR